MTHPSPFLLRALSLITVGLALAAIPCFADTRSAMLAADTTQGVMVGKVDAGSPAEKAGIAVNDIITTVDGSPVQSPLQIGAILGGCKPGDTMEVTITRAADGASVNVGVKLGSSPRDASRPYMGISFFGWMQIVPKGSASPDSTQASPIV
jgi:PDZ domain-containing secreted protein